MNFIISIVFFSSLVKQLKFNKVLPEGAAFVVGVVLDENDPRIDQARKMANACIDVTGAKQYSTHSFSFL